MVLQLLLLLLMLLIHFEIPQDLLQLYSFIHFIQELTELQLSLEPQAFIRRGPRRWMEDFQIADVNHIKPGVAEATRVMLRRVPAYLILQSLEDQDVQHLKWLAKEKSVPIIIETLMPFKAVAFIKVLKHNDFKAAE